MVSPALISISVGLLAWGWSRGFAGANQGIIGHGKQTQSGQGFPCAADTR
jgi:hypothetical protein